MSRYTANDSLISCDVGVDLSLLPPCKKSLHMHIERANYQARLWRLAHTNTPDVPGPVGHGWCKNTDSTLSCQWFRGNCMPQYLIDLLDDGRDASNISDDDDTDEDRDYDSEDDDIFETYNDEDNDSGDDNE